MTGFATLLVAWALAVAPAGAPGLDDYDAARARFGEALVRWRGGEVSAREPLSAAAARLCDAWDRCDAVRVADHYLALGPEERAEGLRDEERFGALYARVEAAGEAGSRGERWAAERRVILDALGELAREVRGKPDFVPAAQALSLRARIQQQRAFSDPTLEGEEQRALLDAALGEAREATAMFLRAGQVTRALEPTWVEGRILLKREELGAAEQAFRRCERDAERVGQDAFREYAIRGRVLVAKMRGQPREAQRLLRSIAAFRPAGASWELVRDWTSQLVSQDHVESALDFLARHRPPDDAHFHDLVEWDTWMGGILLRLGEIDRAREHVERAAEDASTEVAVLILARLALEEELPFEVIRLLDDGGVLEDFTTDGRVHGWTLLGEAYLLDGDPDSAIECLETALAEGRAVGERTALEADGDGTPIGSVTGEVVGLHTVALLADAHAARGDALAALRIIETDQARELRRGSGAAELRRAIGAEPELTDSDVAAWVGHAELGCLSWVVGADFTRVVHAVRGPSGPRATTARIPHGRRTVADAVRRLREAVQASDGAGAARVGDEVVRTILPAPIRAELVRSVEELDGRRGRLLVLPHGPLEGLPFSALELEGRPWDEWLDTIVLPGLPAPQPGAAPDPGELDWTLAGDPVDPDGAVELVGAGAELRALRAMRAGATLLRGPDFTRAAFEDALGSGRALHLATHLLPDEEGSFALRFSNGDAMALGAIDELRPALPLAVLSTCESGSGPLLDGEGLVGLSRAFLRGGTRNLVVTTWPVEDAAAQRFGVAFHRGLFDGLTPSRAAARARRELRASDVALADWAAFRLVGRE